MIPKPGETPGDWWDNTESSQGRAKAAQRHGYSGEPHQRPEAEAVFASICDDRFPVEFQQMLARRRLGVSADVLPGGHLLALSQPVPLARYLLSI